MTSVLFDLDGVLADSRAAITTCINRALREGDHAEHPAPELERFIGPALADVFAELLGQPRDDEAVVACVAAYRRIYATESLRLTTLVPGVEEMLDEIDQPKAIASSKPVAFSEPILERLGIRHHFAAVEGPDLNPFGETKATTIAKALEAVGRPAVMVGDRRHDVEGARVNGIPCIGVAWGIGSRAELENAGAVAIAPRPEDLPEMLKDLARLSN
jgi:phosphoglycolate phosphatase